MLVTTKKTANDSHILSEKISVIIPAYNEAEHLKECVATLETALQKLDLNFEVIITEDGSTDGTDKVAQELSDEDSAVKHLHNAVRLGRGKAVHKAFESAEGNVIIYTDVDLSTDLQHIADMIKAVENGADIATGSRLIRGSVVKRTFLREMTSRVYNLLIRVMFRSPISDHQCGFKAFRKATVGTLLNKVKGKHWFWDTELIIRAVKQGYSVVEIPVKWVQSDETKVRLGSDAKQMTANMLKLWWQLKKEKKKLDISEKKE